ncbi:MAG: GNAT family protein [Anaerolineae bacterium]
MWRETYCVKHLLHFLRNYTYRDLPSALFDRYLWLYAEVEEFQNQVVYGFSQKPDLHLYEAIEYDRISAIATVLLKDGILYIKLDSLQDWTLDLFLLDILAQYKEAQFSLTVSNLQHASRIAKLLNSEVVLGKVKYYTTHVVPLSDLPVKEIGLTDEHPVQLDYFWRCLPFGQRSFGLFLDNCFKTMASLVQLTCLQAQIISVQTFGESDRQKGYAKAVCAFVLNEGLLNAPIVTWSTSLSNIASCRTAESLGMKPYYGLYEICGRI